MLNCHISVSTVLSRTLLDLDKGSGFAKPAPFGENPACDPVQDDYQCSCNDTGRTLLGDCCMFARRLSLNIVLVDVHEIVPVFLDDAKTKLS